MRKNLLSFFALAGACMIHGFGFAQPYSMTVDISEQASVALTNYQVHLDINTEALVIQGKMNADGSDIRFYSDSCLTATLSHWVEAGINTANTDIWVLVPSIPANMVTSIYMGYGDPFAANTSNFATTFPAAIVSGGAPLNLTGTVNTDWFQLDAGDVLTLGNGAPLTINARKIIISGTVSGNGAGYAGGVATASVGQAGTGPGAGTPSNPLNSGSGGGSYGGVGGTGGYDAGDTPGVGGAIYGTTTGTDFDMGSGGAASDLSAGGAGGGALSMDAEFINITGTISMNGASAQQPGSGRGGGGGAGGSLLVMASELNLAGTISANGGGGSVGTSTANDDGGSGAGGRVKFFYSQSINNTATVTVTGGPTGPNGTAAPPTPGGVGTIHEEGLIVIDDLVISTGSEVNYAFTPSIVVTGNECEGQTVTLSAGGAYPSYLWTGGSTNSSIDVFVSGTYTLSAGIPGTPAACGFAAATSVTIDFLPAPVVDLGVDLTLCDTASVTLDAGPGMATYDWSTGASTQTITVDGATLGLGTFPFAVTVTGANGCEATSDISIEVIDCTSGIEETAFAQLFEIYPNPTSGELYVKIDLVDEMPTVLSITDMSGKRVYTHANFNAQNVQAIDVSALQAGTYFVEISNANGRATRMIVKN